MSSQQLNRIAACVAIITLCIACAGFFPGQLAAEHDRSESPAAREHQARPVRLVPGFNILQQLEYTLAQRLGFYWFLPGCWRCDQRSRALQSGLSSTTSRVVVTRASLEE